MTKRKSPLEDSVQQVRPLRRSTRQKTAGSVDPGGIEKPLAVAKSAETKGMAHKNSASDTTGKGKTNGKGETKKAVVKRHNGHSKDAHAAAAVERSLDRTDHDDEKNGARQYWLMKAEPESRIEKGKDVKFSIDDLAARTEPEPWDGIRAYPARNNLRSMKKGDLAFFYHSNTKTPSIVGTMEIVQEHSPDMSAQDPAAIYYDAKDTDPANPKWSVVHVEFREKFKRAISLQELRDLAAQNDGLEGMQMLRQSRLSVSAVSPSEWIYIQKWLKDHEE